MKYTLTQCSGDEEWNVHGLDGLMPDWLVGLGENILPVDGIGAAHDILEHDIRDGMGIKAEFKALGAMVFIRGLEYWFERSTLTVSWKKLIGTNIDEIFKREHLDLVDAPYMPRLERGMDDGRDAINEIIKEARQILFDNPEFYELGLTEAQLDAKLIQTKAWMRHGYKFARQRFHDQGHSAVALFANIEQLAGNALRVLDPGDKVDIHVCFKEFRAWSQLYSPYWRGAYR